MNRLRCSLALGVGTAAALGLVATQVRLNTSASLPRGLYLLSSHRPALADLILFCPPRWAANLAAARRYLPAGSCPGHVEPMGKILFASSGDLLELTPAGIAINDRPLPASQPRSFDSAGRPLAHYPYGRYTVTLGQFWVFAPHPRSFDSRYFGPVPASHVVGSLSPLWTLSQTAIERAADTVRRSSRGRG
jgi:conjugative transfer signal peptidase TraF